MPYVINKGRQIISISSKIIVNNKTGELPVKIYDNVVQMTDGKLYWINLFGIISNSTLIKIKTYYLDPYVNNFQPRYDSEYVIQQFFDKFVIVDDKLFILRINVNFSCDPFTIESLYINNVHNLDNVKIFDYRHILFVSDDNNLILEKNGQSYLLDENVCCEKMWICSHDVYLYGFFVALYSNRKIIIQNYKKKNGNDVYHLTCEHEFTLETCVEQIYPRMLIGTNGHVYYHDFNNFSSQCPFLNNYVNDITQHNIDVPIREILYYADNYYYLSDDGKIIDSDSNIIITDIYGSCVPKTNTKSANF